MKYQEALNRIAKYCGVNNGSMLEDDLKTLQKLVDRATPKKVVDKPPFKSFGWCPSCNCSISRRHYPKFCGCGQALDWSEIT